MPVEQPLGVQGFVVAPSRVQHHLNDTLHVPVPLTHAADVHTETPRDRGSDLTRVEFVPLDVAALDDVLDQRAEHRFALQIEAEGLHAADEATLPVPDVGQHVGHYLVIPVKARPVGPFVDVHSPHFTR